MLVLIQLPIKRSGADFENLCGFFAIPGGHFERLFDGPAFDLVHGFSDEFAR